MNLEQNPMDKALKHSDRRALTFYVGVLAVPATLGTVADSFNGSFDPLKVGATLVLLYGLVLAAQGWRQGEARLSCAALMVLPALFLAAYLASRG